MGGRLPRPAGRRRGPAVRRCRTQIAQVWAKSWAEFKLLIGILSLTIWASPDICPARLTPRAWCSRRPPLPQARTQHERPHRRGHRRSPHPRPRRARRASPTPPGPGRRTYRRRGARVGVSLRRPVDNHEWTVQGGVRLTSTPAPGIEPEPEAVRDARRRLLVIHVTTCGCLGAQRPSHNIRISCARMMRA